jgi:methionyl-tRNA formyltransferase
VFGALANGDKETGVSIMRMTEEIDLGPVLGQQRTVLSRKGPSSLENRETLTKRLGILGGKLIVKTLKKLQNGQINEVKQPPKSPTPYTRRLTKESGRINWSQSPIQIERFIRAAFPWPGAWTEYGDKGQGLKAKEKPIKIIKAHLSLIQHSTFNIQHSLVIDLVQLPGKNPITWNQFLAGHPGAELG